MVSDEEMAARCAAWKERMRSGESLLPSEWPRCRAQISRHELPPNRVPVVRSKVVSEINRLQQRKVKYETEKQRQTVAAEQLEKLCVELDELQRFDDEVVKQHYGFMSAADKQSARERLMEEQDGRCPICRRFFTEDNPPHLDHCHESNVLRGLVCRDCNFGLGWFRDSVLSLDNAAQYLLKYSKLAAKRSTDF